MIFYPDLQIAAGHNNQAGLTRIESITPVGDTRAFVYPVAWYNFNPGLFAIRSDGTFYLRGKQITAWTFSFMSKLQYQYMSDTWCAGGYDGPVTVKTPMRTATSNAIINARIRIPKPSETENILGKIGRPVRVTFASIEVLTAGA